MTRKSPITEMVEKEIAEQEKHIAKIRKLSETIHAREKAGEAVVLDQEDLDIVKRALMAHASDITMDANRRREALKAGSEDGDLRSHSEKYVLQGCLQLMTDVANWFLTYLECIGVDPDEFQEFPLSIPAQYGHIVRYLFLWNTSHSGGTSTMAKCRELGVEYDGEVEIIDLERMNGWR